MYRCLGQPGAKVIMLGVWPKSPLYLSLPAGGPVDPRQAHTQEHGFAGNVSGGSGQTVPQGGLVVVPPSSTSPPSGPGGDEGVMAEMTALNSREQEVVS